MGRGEKECDVNPSLNGPERNTPCVCEIMGGFHEDYAGCDEPPFPPPVLTPKAIRKVRLRISRVTRGRISAPPLEED